MTDSTIKNLATIFPINAEALKPDPSAHRRRSIVREFSLNTSTHGLAGIARSESIPNRIFWSATTLIFTGVMCYFVVEAISDYFQYPTQTSITIAVEWPQDFPAVSICNYSPLRYDRFIGPFLNYTNSLNLTNTNDTTTFTQKEASYIRDFLGYKINRDEPLVDFFYPLSAMLLQCVYNGFPCSATDFTPFNSPSYGLCYTFNGKSNNISGSKIRLNTDYGGKGILLLRLYAQSHEYVPYVSAATGMMGIIHDNAQLPMIDMAGMQLGPGRHHKLSYTKQTTYSLSSPYSDCTNKVTLGMKAMFDQFPGVDYAYSQSACYTVCTQAYTYQKCGCVNPMQWAARWVVLPGSSTIIHAPLCNTNDPCYVKAETELMNTPSLWVLFCSECTQECTSVDFIIKSSSLSAPPRFLLTDVKRILESSSFPLSASWNTTWSSDIPANYVALEVVCESNRITNYTQEATLSAVDLLSNVGGQTGLWIGISFLSLMEVAEMLFRLIRYQYHVILRKVRKRTHQQVTAASEMDS